MKFLFLILVLLVAVAAYFLYQGNRSQRLAGAKIANAQLPVCGSKPNCVCSKQDKSDDAHYIAPIALNGAAVDSVRNAVEQLGGVIVSADANQLHATFVSAIFKFTDDVLLLLENDTLHVYSASRVGHSDLGANRKRVEALRKQLE